MSKNVSHQFDRLPTTVDERDVEGRATRQGVLDFWAENYGIPPETFDDFTFWEKGAGKVWILHGEVPSPLAIEALGMLFLRTRQEHWKPTTDAVQRFGLHATKNVIELDREQAATFVRGDDQDIEWDGDWGYIFPAHEIAGELEVLGVGLYLRGELRSMIPKGRRRDF